MRHIPEEELHTYLDQALSRSQCVEIERHLAGCDMCRRERDGIAALRDRTTALLAVLAPPRTIPPAFETLQGRAVAEAADRRHRVRTAVWVASILAALGMGWGASALVHDAEDRARLMAQRPERTAPPATAAAPAVPTPAVRQATLAPRHADSAREPVTQPKDEAAGTRRGPARTVRPAEELRPAQLQPATIQLSSSSLPSSGTDLDLRGMWRTVSLDGAQAEFGELPPRIDGLPVVQVQMQKATDGQKPTMVIAQQLKSGEVIRTIEGPAADVSSLLSRPSATGPASPWPTFKPDTDLGSIQGRDGAMALRYGDRILAITGHLPSDSLLAMIRRLNVERRGGR